MHNVVSIIGHLGADPEIKYTPSGTCIANLRLAVNEHRKNQATGESTQQTHWFTAVAFGKTAEVVANFCNKGGKIGIIGKLVQREWQPAEGPKRSVVEIRVDSIELLNSQNQQNGQSQGQGQQQRPPTSNNQGQNRSAPPPPPPSRSNGYSQQPQNTQGYPPPDDDIPF
ncbi:MAG: single-stranded DNA-binding protein [Syntrophobacteraceae bacterium]